MSKKRSNGEGNVYRRANGTWEARLSWTDGNGMVRRKSFYGATQKDARAKMAAARDRLKTGGPVSDDSRPLAEWLAHWRATALEASPRKPATRELYATLARKHLETGDLGTIPLGKIKPSHVDALVVKLRDAGLSESTVRSIYTTLRVALDDAVRDGLLATNPAAAVKRPHVARHEAAHLSPADVVRLLDAAKDSRHHLALTLIATTGLRKGEALALRWTDLDLDGGLLRVAGTLGRVGGKLTVSEPKTTRSRRAVPLSSALTAALKQHRTAQLQERLIAGNQWRDTGLVFTTELGGPVDPRNVLRSLQVAAERSELGGVGVHTLRHSAATAWLAGGVHIKAVADLLGHSSVAITGDVYGHASDDTARAAIGGLAAQLGT